MMKDTNLMGNDLTIVDVDVFVTNTNSMSTHYLEVNVYYYKYLPYLKQ